MVYVHCCIFFLLALFCNPSVTSLAFFTTKKISYPASRRATSTTMPEPTAAATGSSLFQASTSPLLTSFEEESMSRQSSSSQQQPAPLLISLRDHLLVGAATMTSNQNTDNKSNKISLVLASQSPRRLEILNMMGLQGLFSVNPSPLDESILQQQLQGTDPIEYTRQLAVEKAMALAQSLDHNEPNKAVTTTLVLGSDTIVAHEGHILEKPVDEADARRMLSKLQGAQHAVHTGVALVAVHPCAAEGNKSEESTAVQLVEAFTDTARVTFAPLSDTDISAYVATGEPMDKAGSYGIQGIGGQFVTAIDGDFFTVMGLPMHRTSKALAAAMLKLLS